MVRGPAGWHLGAGSLPAVGSAPRRQPATTQRAYWRHTTAELRVGANAVLPQFIPVGGTFSGRAVMAPQGVGERWLVEVVRVTTSQGYGTPPLVAQQISAQALGTVTVPSPPPVVAQVWLQIGGVDIHLLGQTTQGGNDDLSLGGQPVSAGEAISVVWYGFSGALPIISAWCMARGTRLALDT